MTVTDSSPAATRLEANALTLGYADTAVVSDLDVQVPVFGTLLGLYFGASPATDYDAARQTDEKRYAAFFHAMLERGVALPPSPFEALFPSLAHTKEELERTADTDLEPRLVRVEAVLARRSGPAREAGDAPDDR